MNCYDSSRLDSKIFKASIRDSRTVESRFRKIVIVIQGDMNIRT